MLARSLALCSTAFAVAPLFAQSCPQKHHGSEADWADHLALDADLSGDRAIAGAWGIDGPTSSDLNQGGAYVFERLSNGQWREAQLLSANHPRGGDRFGWSVAIGGDWAMSSATGNDSNGSFAGAVFAFQRLGNGTWTQRQKILASDGAADDQFGAALALQGDVLVVATRDQDLPGPAYGSVYVFRFDPVSGDWLEEQVLIHPTAGANTIFGSSVALDGDVLAVGTVSDQSVQVFRDDPLLASWEFEQELVPQATVFGSVGWDVAVSGDVVVAGAPTDDVQANNAGAAHVFRYDPLSASWSEEQKLFAPLGQTNRRFGQNVGIDGELLAVGAPNTSLISSTTTEGTVWLFRRQAGTWVMTEQLIDETPQNHEKFGDIVDVSGETVLVGTPEEFTFGNESGSVTFFDSDPTDCDGNGLYDVCELLEGAAEDLDQNGLIDVCEALGATYCAPAVANSTGAPGRLLATGSDVVLDNDFRVVAAQLPSGQFGYFLASLNQDSVPLAGGSAGTLCLAAPIARFVGQVGNTGAGSLFAAQLDLTAFPANPTTAVVAGETWNFQAWYRDVGSSNFSDAVSVLFQ